MTERPCATCPVIITGHKNLKYCRECYVANSRKRARDRARRIAAELREKIFPGITTTKEGRKKYSHLYYLANKTKAQEYQKAYTKTHKKRADKTAWQGVAKTVLTAADFMHVAAGKTEKVLEAILNRTVGITF
jgi:hypothetical protein